MALITGRAFLLLIFLHNILHLDGGDPASAHGLESPSGRRPHRMVSPSGRALASPAAPPPLSLLSKARDRSSAQSSTGNADPGTRRPGRPRKQANVPSERRPKGRPRQRIVVRFTACVAPGCQKRPSFGQVDNAGGVWRAPASRCSKHRIPGDVDVVNSMCLTAGCERAAVFGGPDTGWKRHFCKRHCKSMHVNLAYLRPWNLSTSVLRESSDTLPVGHAPAVFADPCKQTVCVPAQDTTESGCLFGCMGECAGARDHHLAESVTWRTGRGT